MNVKGFSSCTHSKKCGVHSTPSGCHTMECAPHQLKFGVLCTPSSGVKNFWCAMHTTCGVHNTLYIRGTE